MPTVALVQRFEPLTAATFLFQDDSDHEVDLSTIEIDPDEPTYCLCDQVCLKSTKHDLRWNEPRPKAKIDLMFSEVGKVKIK